MTDMEWKPVIGDMDKQETGNYIETLKDSNYTNGATGIIIIIVMIIYFDTPVTVGNGSCVHCCKWVLHFSISGFCYIYDVIVITG